MASDPLPTPRAVLTSFVSSNLCLFLAAEWVGLKKLMGLSIRVKRSRDRERKGFGAASRQRTCGRVATQGKVGSTNL